ncbi:hypothetical protein OEA41_005360 [Lepraria neglecta]|uniref:Uncharacterized protein n=1 Tax=Lepraria neglecta TaxID=209136 RepID=A0AAE0DFI5_9LECA|nr:hypothetical protein OEA41_005360 [Lepraria neglecta]
MYLAMIRGSSKAKVATAAPHQFPYGKGKSNPTTVIGQFLANLKAENRKGKRGALVSYWNDAIGSTWRNPEVWADAEVEYRSHSDEVKQMMATLKQRFRGDKQSKFEICDRDEIAGEDESILEGFPDDAIYLGADQEGTAVLFRWPSEITYLLGGDILTKASNDIKTYA